MSDLVLPSRLGLPEKFESWRPGQESAILSLIDDDRRFTCISAPTGSGKSLTYTAAGMLTRKRFLILTGSKALQDQLVGDFGAVGMTDVRGRSNFDCGFGGVTCEDGAVLRCPACPYRVQVKNASEARMVVTNYDFWLSIKDSSTSIGKFDYLILDEVHMADDKVCKHLEIKLLTKTIYKELQMRFPTSRNLTIWRKWAGEALAKCQLIERDQERAIENYGARPSADMLRRSAMLRRLHKTLARLHEARGYWVLSQIDGGYLWSILWAKPYTEEMLYRGIERIALFSATLVRKTVELLGISPSVSSYTEYPWTFPVERCRILHIPTARMSARSDEADWKRWVETADNIFRSRRDRKGLFHTISYRNRDRVLKDSEFTRSMVTHERDDTAQVIGRFEFERPPSYLISPSIETGYDFAGEKAEFQIIGKLPFPDSRIPVLRARQESDPNYGHHLMIQRLVQACGRIMRYHFDQGETFIIDDNILWSRTRYQRLYPTYFLRLLRLSQRIPTPPPPLRKARKQ